MIIPAHTDFPVNQPQLEYPDMLPKTATHRKRQANVKPYLDQRGDPGPRIPMMTQRDHTMIQKPCLDAINQPTRRPKFGGGKENYVMKP